MGFPHSEICGSRPIRGSPQLIAAYHVLHRLSTPRHPPNALLILDRSRLRRPTPNTTVTPLARSLDCKADHPPKRITQLIPSQHYRTFRAGPSRIDPRGSPPGFPTERPVAHMFHDVQHPYGTATRYRVPSSELCLSTPSHSQPGARYVPPANPLRVRLFSKSTHPSGTVIPIRSLSTSQQSAATDQPGGGGGRDRTDDLKLAKLPLSQLSYAPDRRYRSTKAYTVNATCEPWDLEKARKGCAGGGQPRSRSPEGDNSQLVQPDP